MLKYVGAVVALVGGLALASCTGNSDNADSISGPGVSVHCGALLPGQSGGVGSTTVKVDCPPPS